MKILVVDDDATIRDLFRRELVDLGHEVLLADNGQAGYEAAMSNNPDVVISDMQMPFLSGDKMLAKILERRPWVRCYGMSGSTLGWKLPKGVILHRKPEAIGEIIDDVGGQT